MGLVTAIFEVDLEWYLVEQNKIVLIALMKSNGLEYVFSFSRSNSDFDWFI
jgi:hypothetical protein